ncbi:MAG: permease [Labilithrix sp.]|nr:permease [Labilithrix sp.]
MRGAALFGVLAVNLLTQFRVSLFEQFLPEGAGAPPPSSIDHVVGRVLAIGLEWKAFTLFSLLFGVGLAAQRERLARRGIGFGTYAARRLGFLLVLGLVHLFLIWNGDVLTLYAVIGAIAAPMLRLRTRWLLAIALAMFVVQVLPLPFPPPFTSVHALNRHVVEAKQIYGQGSFGDALSFRIREVRPIGALLLWTTPRTLGLFLLGACAWREGLFRGEHRTLLRVVAASGIVVGLALSWALTTRALDFRTWRDAASAWSSIVLALGYGAAMLLAPWRAALSVLAPVGRMALTSYLTQSIVLEALFYGWGLGLFGRLGEASAGLLAIAIFVVQIVVSAAWLGRYRFGPVEWLWRSFTYGARQPMRP